MPCDVYTDTATEPLPRRESQRRRHAEVGSVRRDLYRQQYSVKGIVLGTV